MERAPIENGTIVKHFKREVYDGDVENMFLYKVISIKAIDVNTMKCVTVYMSLYEHDGVKIGDVFVRDYDEFMSEVDNNKYPNIKQKYRFEVNN